MEIASINLIQGTHSCIRQVGPLQGSSRSATLSLGYFQGSLRLERFPQHALSSKHPGSQKLVCILIRTQHILRRSTLEAFDGKSQTIPHEHIAHCLDVLRDDVMCNADDTPRYTGRLNQQKSVEHPTSGVGQTRLCRDWTQLEQWAGEHSACYRPINMGDAKFPPIERYKFCPNGEKLWP